MRFLKLFTLLFSSFAFSLSVNDLLENEYVPGELLIQMKSDANPMSFSSLTVNAKKVTDLTPLMKVKLKETSILQNRLGLNDRISQIGTMLATIRRLQKDPNVAFVEPNYIYRVDPIRIDDPVDFERVIRSRIPNDPQFEDLWGLSFIEAPKAWTKSIGSNDVIVGVIDTGVDYNHPDLRDNMWSRTLDDGRVIHGYNAINDSLDPLDDHDHGTHVAGTIGAVGNNNLGVVGVNWKVKIMALKFLSASGGGSTEGAIKAIDWATKNGAHLTNNSWGGGGRSEALYDAISRAQEKGIVFVAAAGNESNDNDQRASYPASYDHDNIISVAAISSNGSRAGFSNYGVTTVDIGAPGDAILSTVRNGGYDSFRGTSMASPHVAGAVALALAHDSDLNAMDARSEIFASATKHRVHKKSIGHGGALLNVHNLLSGIYPEAPIDVPDDSWSAKIDHRIESDHPYGNNERERWEISHPGVKFLRVHFSQFNLERGYDFVNLIDPDSGAVLETLTGDLGNDVWSGEVEGDSVIVEFTTDGSVTRDGFVLDGYSWSNFSQ